MSLSPPKADEPTKDLNDFAGAQAQTQNPPFIAGGPVAAKPSDKPAQNTASQQTVVDSLYVHWHSVAMPCTSGLEPLH
jgi:hypothetical protein